MNKHVLERVTLHWLPAMLWLIALSVSPGALPHGTDALAADGLPDALMRRAESGEVEAQFEVAHALEKGEGVPRDVQEAEVWYRRAAESGHAESQYRLGMLYYGHAISRDYAKAEKWFRKAIAKGHAGAEFQIGLMYEYGYGLPQNYKEATLWYRRAAAKEHVAAQTNLAWMYFKGLGVPQDDLEAYRWYQRAAEHGDALGMYFMGRIHQEGRGVERDLVMAHMWFNLSAASAKRHLRHQAANSRDEVSEQLNPEQVLEAQRLAKIWFEKHSDVR